MWDFENKNNQNSFVKINSWKDRKNASFWKLLIGTM